MRYSIILPTFGRPDDVNEFLESVSKLYYENYEIIIVDGSLDDILTPVIDGYNDKIPLQYYHHKGLGASESRNIGATYASGHYLIFIDSDCIIPPDYLNKVHEFLHQNPVDGFGGPDGALTSFTATQKAINYAMTSLFTSGGIRGKKTHVGKFHLRGFNMGIRKEAFEDIGGYSDMQVAEDLDLSMRLLKKGYTTALIPEAIVYHKRKSNFRKFFRQLYMHGKGRIDLHMRHGNALKPLHLLPSAFTLFLILGISSIFYAPEFFIFFFLILSIYTLLLLIDATVQNINLWVGLLSVFASFELLIAYGTGVIRNLLIRMVFGSKKESKKALILKQ